MLTMTIMNCLDFLIVVYSKNLDSLLLVGLLIRVAAAAAAAAADLG
jgi:hypothetical protein